MKYILSPDCFYRSFNQMTVIYKTSKKENYVLNGNVFEILELFKDYNTKKEVVNTIICKYDITDKETEKGLYSFLDELENEEIIIQQNTLSEDKNSVEYQIRSNLIDEFQLYSVQFELTYRCNEKCKHCYCIHEDPREELSTGEVKRIIDELYEMGVFELTFTGGDPFVRKDIFEILEYAYSKNFLIDIFTNGIVLNDSDFFRLKKIYPRSIHFSIYSHIPEKHDKFTGVTGSFDKTVNAIKKCTLLGIPVNIKTNIMTYNYDDIEEIICLAKDLGATIQLSLAVSARNDGDTAPTNFRINTVEKYAEVMNKVSKHIVVNCSDDLTSDRKEGYSICGAGHHGLNINPFGEVYPCNALLICCGNVRKSSIKNIWNFSEELKRIRTFSMEKVEGCEGCEFINQCNFCPGSAMQETGNPLKKYFEACNISKGKIRSNSL